MMNPFLLLGGIQGGAGLFGIVNNYQQAMLEAANLRYAAQQGLTQASIQNAIATTNKANMLYNQEAQIKLGIVEQGTSGNMASSAANLFNSSLASIGGEIRNIDLQIGFTQLTAEGNAAIQRRQADFKERSAVWNAVFGTIGLGADLAINTISLGNQYDTNQKRLERQNRLENLTPEEKKLQDTQRILYKKEVKAEADRIYSEKYPKPLGLTPEQEKELRIQRGLEKREIKAEVDRRYVEKVLTVEKKKKTPAREKKERITENQYMQNIQASLNKDQKTKKKGYIKQGFDQFKSYFK